MTMVRTYSRMPAGTYQNKVRVQQAQIPGLPAWQSPNLAAAPWTDQQKLSVASRMATALSNPTFLNRNISLWNPPADSLPFIVTPSPFPNYPAPGGFPEVIIQYVVPVGQLAVITKLAIVDNGGNTIGTGNVLWNVLINGGAIDGLGNITSPVGTYAQPNDFVFVAHEQDVVQVTVQVAGGSPAQNGTTAARLHGWTYPLQQATSTEASGGVLQ